MRMQQHRKIITGEQPLNYGGHSMYCAKCETIKVQAFEKQDDRTPPVLEMKCRSCNTITATYEFVAGGWIPAGLVRTFEAFIDTRASEIEARDIRTSHPIMDPEDRKIIREVARKIKRLSWRRRAHDDEAPMPKLGMFPPSDNVKWPQLEIEDHSYRGAPLGRIGRLKAWMTCKRYLLFIAIPASVPLLLMGACGVLFYLGIYVHPIYEWIAPLWRPWMHSVWLAVAPIVASVGLLAGYVRCRLDNKVEKMSEIDEALYGEQHGNEHDVLRGIDEL